MSEEFIRKEKDRLQWAIACSPDSPDMVVGKYNAIQDAEKRAARNDVAMDMVRKMKEERAN